MQQLDYFLATDDDHRDEYHRILGSDVIRKVSFDVALDTDDLCWELGSSTKPSKDETRRSIIQSPRKTSLGECKSLLKKKLTDNRHTKWIQRQWEKHCSNPARIKHKLSAKNLLGRHHSSVLEPRQRGEGGDSTGANKRRMPLAYSFISFKAGISTVDCTTQLLPPECIHVWRRWKISKTLPLPFRRSAQISNQVSSVPLICDKAVDDVDVSLKRFQREQEITDCSCELFMVSRDASGLGKVEEVASGESKLDHREDPAKAGSIEVASSTDNGGTLDDRVQGEVPGSTNNGCSIDDHVQDEVTRSTKNRCTLDNHVQDVVAGSRNSCYVLDDQDNSVVVGDCYTEEHDEPKAQVVAKEESCASCSADPDCGRSKIIERKQQVCGDPSLVSEASTSEPAATLPRRQSPSSDMTAEVSNYLLFKELIRKISTTNTPAAAESSASVSKIEQQLRAREDQALDSSAPLVEHSSSIHKTIREEVRDPTKFLSPYRALFEDRNKELLQELLTSLSEEAQLIRQAWNCSLEEAKEIQEQDTTASTSENTSQGSKSEKERERVSLFLSLKDGKIQKQELQHDCLSDVVKQQGMSTGFYMKITKEELLKKLPSKTKTSGRVRSVPGARGRASALCCRKML